MASTKSVARLIMNAAPASIAELIALICVENHQVAIFASPGSRWET